MKNNKNNIMEIEQLMHFMQNDRKAFNEEFRTNEDFQSNVQYILEQQIILDQKINNSALVEIASKLETKEHRDQLTNALMLTETEALQFKKLCHDFLEKRLKNPFAKLDSKYIAAKYEELENEEIEQKIKKTKEKKEKETYINKALDVTKSLFHSIVKSLEETAKNNKIFVQQIIAANENLKNSFIDNFDENYNFIENMNDDEKKRYANFNLAIIKALQIVDKNSTTGEVSASFATIFMQHHKIIKAALEQNKLSEIEQILKEKHPEFLAVLKKMGYSLKDYLEISKDDNKANAFAAAYIKEAGLNKKLEKINDITKEVINESEKVIDLKISKKEKEEQSKITENILQVNIQDADTYKTEETEEIKQSQNKPSF